MPLKHIDIIDRLYEIHDPLTLDGKPGEIKAKVTAARAALAALIRQLHGDLKAESADRTEH